VAVTTADPALAQAWAKAGRKLRKAVPRGDRDRLDALVLDLVGVATSGQPPWPPERDAGLLRIGVATATELAKECADTEMLAAAVVLPWYDDALLGQRAPLAARGQPIDWAGAMVLAMVPAGSRFRPSTTDPPAGPYLRQLAALPPLLRGVVLTERALAAAAASGTDVPVFGAVRPFDAAALALLAPGVPRRLLPPGGGPPGPPAEPPPEPVGSPAEAIALVRRQPTKFGAYHMAVDGDPKFVVDSAELVYQVRWDAPPEAIRTVGPPAPNPGDRTNDRYRLPGWIVDRVSRDVHAYDLSSPWLRWYPATRRHYPLPPGWRPEGRPPVPDGLAASAPPPVHAAATPVLHEATARYATLLATETWPDFLVAWRVGLETVRLLGPADPESVTAALLAAQGTAPADTLVGEESDLWRTPAGELARAARPHPDETDGPGAERRAARLAGAPAPARALVVANAQARLTVEGELFGVVPQARRDEMSILSTLVGP
jgi:hypothetical protein